MYRRKSLLSSKNCADQTCIRDVSLGLSFLFFWGERGFGDGEDTFVVVSLHVSWENIFFF